MKYINVKDQKLILDRNLGLPKITDGQIKVEVYSSGVNRADILQRKGHYPPPKGESEIIGLEISGVVVDKHDTVKKFNIGDKVCALLAGGGYAEYVNVHEQQCLPLPKNISLNHGAALMETICTVYDNIFNLCSFQKNEKILIHGGSSGIGTTAISILKNYTDSIIVTVGSKEKCDACKILGATHIINYKETDFLEYLKENKIFPDVILDMVGGDYFDKNLKAMNKKGRMSFIAALNGIKSQINILNIISKQLTITGSTLRSKSIEQKGKIVDQVYQNIWPLIEEEKFKPLIHSEIPFDNAQKAHDLMESSQHIGKILLTVRKEQ